MRERLDPTFVRAQIETLRVTHPAIWDDEETLLLALESETDLREFLIGVVHRMVEAEANVERNDIEIADMKARQKRFEQRIEAMRTLAFKVMNAADVRKMELPRRTLSIRAGTPKVIVTDEAALPPSCVRIRIEPNREAIREQLKRGEPVPGAEMSNAEPVLAVYK